MEVMSSFELDCTIISLGHLETISLLMFGELYMMSYKNFSIRMGLIDVEYTCTTSYSEYYVNLPVHLSPDQV